jgi:hypothetical protein
MTPLENGGDALAKWFAMFGEAFLAPIPAGRRAEVVAEMERRAARELLRDGVWTVDYRRLRVVAVKPLP